MNSKHSHNLDPIRVLSHGYKTALLIIALMAVVIFLILNMIVAEQDDSGIHLSTRQERLANQIVMDTVTVLNKNDGNGVTLNDIRAGLEEMKKNEAALKEMIRDNWKSGADYRNIESIYYALPDNLEMRLEGFYAHVEKFLATDNQAEREAAYTYIVEVMEGSLGRALESSTREFETQSRERVASLRAYHIFALLVLLVALGAEAIFIFRPLTTYIRTYADELKKMADTDSLTGVLNHRSFLYAGEKELRRTRRHQKPMSIALIDIDHFKKVNDTYGHAAGDEVLVTFAEIIKSCIRLEDEVGRLGGEEFALLLPHTPLVGAELVVERVRTLVEQTPIQTQSSEQPIYITASIGLTEIDSEAIDLEAALNIADKAMYEAKNTGRNKVVVRKIVEDKEIQILTDEETDQKKDKRRSA